jgi:putative PIN family toxin of toxin-antitoxin system
MIRVNKLRVVIDTNLLVSAIISSKGLPNKLIRAWEKDDFILTISTRSLKELEVVARRDKFQSYYLFREQILELIDSLKAAADIVLSISDEELPLHSRDLKDDKLLAAALSSKADYLVTGDEDLLVLNGNPALGKLRIITAKDFLELL